MDLSPIYPIYAGLILLTGVVVGSAVILYDELKALRKDVADLKETLKAKQDTEESSH